MLRISVTHDQQIRHADLPAEATVLGAAPECGVQLSFPGVSRRHARVEPLPGGLRLVDLGSKNGLRQRGRRFPEVTLHPGDSVMLGRARLTLENVDTSDALLGASSPAKRRAGVAHHRLDVAEMDDTDTVASDGADSTPAEAIRLLREVELSGSDLASGAGLDLLDRAARVMGAHALFTVTPTGQSPALRPLCGAPPLDGDVILALALGHETAANEVGAVEASEGRWLLVSRIGETELSPLLVGVLASANPHIKTWRRDLFAYIGHRLRPSAAPTRRSHAATARTPSTSALILPDGFVRGRAPATRMLLDQLQATVRSELDVLILGETGTGKEYVARMIHDSGPTARGPFVAVNCAAIPSELLEAELFGVKARIATGVDPRPGLLTRAAGGCVFLDEIGDMPEILQAKLLRALQEREVMPIGAHQPEPIQVRVLSSTNKDLIAMVRKGRFRADLYYRLRGLEFILPPLRDRVEDIAVLALAFADRAAVAHQKEIAGISRRALNLMERHDWPGNVRELRSEIERAVLLCPDGGTLSSQYFGSLAPREERDAATGPTHPGESWPAGSTSPVTRVAPGSHDTASRLARRVDEVETLAIREALRESRGNRTVAARALGITRNGLALKMKRLGIEVD